MKGLDLSKFKKVSSDDKKTVFKHKEGHWLHVAHKGLSKGNRTKLDSLPSYADGGDVDSDTYMPPEQEPAVMPAGDRGKHTATIPVLGSNQQKYMDAMDAIKAKEGPVSGDDPVAPSAAPVMSGPESAPTSAQMGDDRAPAETPMATEQPGQETVPAMPDASPIAQQQDATAPQPTPTAPSQEETNYNKGFADWKQENAQKLGQEDAAWQNDLTNGHVEPETLHSLYEKKSTLGKIGTLFGLIVSGMGSGMAHQSNAALDAMNNEIQRDFEAQKNNKTNAQSFLNLHRQMSETQSQNALRAKQGTLTEAQAQAEAAQADINAQAATLMKMNRGAFHNLALQTQKMAPGPMKQQAEQALAMVGMGIDQKNFNIADVAASKGALAKMLGGGEGGSDTTLLKTMPGMEGVAHDIEGKTVPGVGRAQIPVPQETRDRLTALQQYDQKAKEYVNFANQHKNNWANLNPAQRMAISNQGAAMGANLQSLYRNKIKGGVYKKGEQEFIQQIIPDNPANWKAGFNAIPKVQQTINDNSNDLQTTAKSVGLPMQQAAKVPPGGTQEGAIQKSKSGKPIVFRGGKWHYQQGN